MESKKLLYLIMLIIDIIFIYLIVKNKNTDFDKYFISTILLSNLFFYYVAKNKKKLFLNKLILILPFLSIFVNNNYIKMIMLGLIFTIQVLKKIKGKSIFDSLPTNLKNLLNRNEISTLFLIFSIILLFQINYKKSKRIIIKIIQFI